MNIERLYELFKLGNTKRRDGITPNASFFRKYGNVTFEEAFEVYLREINSFMELRKKIDEFESFLIGSGCKRIDSGVSESRYYYYNSIKYRFSSHVYPTGSMTNNVMGVVDLAADPELIENINF